MNKLYFFQAFLVFVKSLIGIFVPAYMYSIGFSFSLIIWYIIGTSLTYLIFLPLSIKLINKLGFKLSILLSLPIYMFHITSLNFLSPDNLITFYLSSISFALHIVIFWPAMHAEVATNGTKNKRGSELGTLQILTTMFGSLAPLIGGFYLEILSYSQLLSIGMTILFLGSLPLLISKDIKLKPLNFSYSSYPRLLNDNKSQFKAFFAEGINSFLNLSFWPVLLYILLSESFVGLGGLYSAVSFISILLILYMKKYIDKNDKKKILNHTINLLSISWFLRLLMFILTGVFMYIVEAIFKMTMATFNLSYLSVFYNNANSRNILEYIILREVGIHIAKILFGFLGLLLIHIFGPIKEIFMLFLLIAIFSTVFLKKIY